MPGSATTSSRVLLLDNDPGMRSRVTEILEGEGYLVTGLPLGREALDVLDARDHDATLISLDGPTSSAEAWVRSLRQRAPTTPVLVLADAERVQSAVAVLRDGADDYMLRPPAPAELSARLGRILERNDLDSRIAFFQDELSKKSDFRGVEARSPAMRGVLERVRRVAPMRSTVLVLGESGVGKELIARSIHFNSPRREEPFIALNCAAMPSNLIESELFGHEKGSFTGAHSRARGKFEIANRGTLFLDEVGELDPATQAKLLRVLEEREFMRIGGNQSIHVDVRVITATNANLEEMVARKLFRRDLYYRLKVVTIRVPPLRERRQDIPGLVETFLDQLSRANAVPTKTVTPEALAALQAYYWPGNVRELKNLLESVLVSDTRPEIHPDDLPGSVHRRQSSSENLDLVPGMTLEEMERELIRRTLVHTGGNRTHAASLLGIGVRTLQRKIRLYGIDIAPKRRRPRRRNRERGGEG
jgi:DNA-binding NtrC family response regulator